MPEVGYSSVELEPLSEQGHSHQEPRGTLSRSRSNAKEAVLKVNRYIRESYVVVQPTLAKTKEAVRNVSRVKVAKILFLHLGALGCIIISITLLAYIGEIPGFVNATSYDVSETCRPDGSFDVGIYYDVYNNWSPSGVFQITLGFGELPFSTVKIIDVIWDIIVGRGGQALLTGTSYVIFSKSLLRIMERKSVSYGTFEVLGFQTASATTIFKLMRDYLTNHGVRAKFSILWIILSSIYVVAFPTLASAMTGYSANSHAYVRDYSGSLSLWSAYKPVQYIINDGWRVGLTGRDILTDIDEHNSPYYYDTCCGNRGPDITNNTTVPTIVIVDWSPTPSNCTLLWHVSQYVEQYGFNGTNHSSSTFNSSGKIYTLPSPVLNITTYYPEDNLWGSVSSGSIYDPSVGFNYSDGTKALYALDNNTYDLDYIQANGSCEPRPTYRWGFSFLLLFVTVLLTTIWTIGMYIMWLDAYLYSRFDRAHRDMGTHRAALDFAAAMRKDIGEDTTEDLSNSELKKRVKRGLNGWRVGYDMMDGEKVPLSRAQELGMFWERRGPHGWSQWSRRKRIIVLLVAAVVLVVIVLMAVMTSSR